MPITGHSVEDIADDVDQEFRTVRTFRGKITFDGDVPCLEFRLRAMRAHPVAAGWRREMVDLKWNGRHVCEYQIRDVETPRAS